MPVTPVEALRLRRRYALDAQLVFDTAWRIGSGKEGETMSDLGVVLDPSGRPVLPGSSLKGKLRATCEALAHALNLSACQLNVAASGVRCASDVNWFYGNEENTRGRRAAIEAGPQALLDFIAANTCDVCKLFGSPLQAARLRCADGTLWDDAAPVVQVRDGVVLDRDSHTAVRGLKYDYEVAPAGVRYGVRFDLDNATDADLALFGAALFEWTAGASLGGGTGRGLGRFRLENVRLRGVDFAVAKQRIAYLTNTDPDRRLSPVADWEAFFTPYIDRQAAAPPEG